MILSITYEMTLIFRKLGGQIVTRCVLDNEFPSILSFSHEHVCGGHFSPRRTVRKILDCGFF